MNSSKWKEQISDRIHTRVYPANPMISEDKKIDAVVNHYMLSTKRDLNYLGNLLVARSNIICYGGGDSSNLIISSMASVILCENELAEVNFQLDCITVFELDMIDELKEQDVRAEWIDAADYMDYLASFVDHEEDIPTIEQVADTFLSTLLGPYLMIHMTEPRTLH